MALNPGTRLGPYEIVGAIGAGGMGEVYRARDTKLDRDVAIKILPLDAAGASVRRERFFREARAASSLIHPNIITIHEINSADGLDFIVMELVRGEALSGVLARGPLTIKRAVEYAVQICDALKTAHDAGIVHRDLKPGNIMITASGLVKVLDFGIAKRVDDPAADGERPTAAPLTVAGTSIGTPAYMSPEQTLGDPVDARSDLFSFGVVLYEMVAGRLPFQATTTLNLVRQIVHDPPTPLRASVSDVPQALVDVVDRCLLKNPDDRYQTAAELAADLRRVAARFAGMVGAEETPTGTMTLPRVTPVRRRMPRWILAMVGGVLFLAVAWISGPALVRWVRVSTTPQTQLADADASPLELYGRATELLRVYYREGNLEKAIGQLERALQLKSPYPLVEARLSLAYWRKNELNPDGEWQKRAMAHAERAVSGDDQLAVGHIALGAALVLAGDLDKAAASYQKAATLDPANWELLWRLGDLSMARRNPDRSAAGDLYRRSTEAGPGEWESYSRLGSFQYAQARYTEAIQSFEKVRELAPDHARTYSNLAAAYHQLGRTDEAAAVLQRALEISPDSITYSNLGTYLYFQGKYPEALAAFDQAVKLNANLYTRWGNMADAARMVAPGAGKMHEGYRRAIQLAEERLAKAEDPNVRSSVALYAIRDGQPQKALAELDKVLAQKGLRPGVLFKATLVAELANQRARALGLLRQALEAGYQLREISAEPDLVKLRADPEYHKLASHYEK
jgi:serine/threonine-protein kinase